MNNLEILTQDEAANLLRVSPRTLERMRMTGTGPRYTRMSARRVGYRQSDIEAWLDANTRTSTSDTGAAA